MAQLYAACRQHDVLIIKHVQLTQQVQNQLDGVFQAQEALFMAGINNEIDFNGDWKPDSDELLVARQLAEAQILLASVSQNAVALPVLDVVNFKTEGVKGLFSLAGQGPQSRILIQSFSQQQLLAGRLTFLHDGNVFRRLTEPAFALGDKLLAILDSAGDVRFKSFQMLRRLFDLSQFYQQATDAELATFCGHGSLSIGDTAGFVGNADEGIRKAVHAITKSNVLGTHNVAAIAAQAQGIGFPISITNNRIDVPADRRNAKALFSFLLDKVYLGPMNQRLFITNSNRLL